MTEAAPRIAVPQVEARAWTEPAILAGGGMIADAAQAEAAIWTQSRRDFGEDPRGLRHFLEANPGIKWIQFPSAGIEAYTQANLLDTDHIWTCAKGVYSKPVAEMALALALAGLRNLKTFSTARTWLGESGSFLHGAPVTVFGAGGIGQAIVDLLRPFECQVTIVCRDPARLQTTDRVLPFGSRVEALKGARVVFLAHALTDETVASIGRPELEAMDQDCWLVNVGRGRHVVTEELVRALSDGTIGGAALDVTDPEPLPDEHPLWALPNCIITPHTANPGWQRLLPQRITDNVRRFAAGEPLLGIIDPLLGY